MQRIQSVDVFRFIAFVMIITLHTQPFRLPPPAENKLYESLDAIITNAARFAVPFFFVISGYFWGVKLREGYAPIPFTLKKIGRIFGIFLFWCIVYLIPFDMLKSGMGIGDILDLIVANINTLLFHRPIMILLMEGTKLHLWFLVALMFSMAISAVFMHKNMKTSLLVFSIFLYVFGILAKAYEFTPIGISIRFNTLYGPFFGTLFFVSGYYLSGLKITSKWLLYGAVIFVIGSILHASEVYYLWRTTGELPQQDYVFGTYFMGIGFTMMALSNHPILQIDWLARLGNMALGLYVVHYIFVDLFSEFNKLHDSIIWEVGYVFIVLLLSLLSAYVLSKNRFTKGLVM